jgi:hypothetical protein
MDELRASLERIASGRPADAKAFLFYGCAGKATRPTLARRIRGGARVPWLHRVAECGQRHMRWVLLEVVRKALGPEESERSFRSGEAEPADDEGAGIAS